MLSAARLLVACCFVLALSTASCVEEKAGLGEQCGGYTKDPIGCVTGLFCCQPDPRIFDIPGTCVQQQDRSSVGEACGATTASCCESGAFCSVYDQESGDGTCVADPT